MTFRGIKNATRDLDLLMTSRVEFEVLSTLLRDRGYEALENPIGEYQSLGAALLLDKDGACRFDLFDRKVIRKLRLTEAMKARAEPVFEGSTLRVNALSNEDIFLFKGVAGRPRDTNDMVTLVEAGQGLDFDVIAEAFLDQLPMNSGQAEWELLTGAPEAHPVIAFERAVISLPMTLPDSFTHRIEREADRVYAEFEVVREIATGTTIGKLTSALGARDTVAIDSRDDVESILEGLLRKDLVNVEDEAVTVNRFESS